jgi:rRNA maturation endonuclease Nob1
MKKFKCNNCKKIFPIIPVVIINKKEYCLDCTFQVVPIENTKLQKKNEK